MKRKLFSLLLLILFSVAAGEVLYYVKDGFSARRIHSLNRETDANWSQETQQILEQPYRYIGRGRQCFAFASDDGKYVLKLPRTDIYTLPFWARALPVPAYRSKLDLDHRSRETFILDSFLISANDLKDQTGILAIHLGKSRPKGKKLVLIDASGCTHHLSLEKTAFILQYKQPILMKSFSAALEKGDRKEAEKILDALLSVIVKRAQKGILNRDRSFLRNYGYDGKQAYQIDVGSFFRKPELSRSEIYEKSIRDSVDPIDEWVAKNAPEMEKYLKERLNIYLLHAP